MQPNRITAAIIDCKRDFINKILGLNCINFFVGIANTVH